MIIIKMELQLLPEKNCQFIRYAALSTDSHKKNKKRLDREREDQNEPQ